MLAVKWEFDGDDGELAAAQTVVQRILTKYQRALSGIRCPVHGSASLLIVRGRTLEDLNLSVEPCCQALVDEANAHIHRGRGRRPAGPRPHLTSSAIRRERRRVRRSGPDLKGLFMDHA